MSSNNLSNLFVSSMNFNRVILRRRHQRSINRRIRRQRRRIMNRIYAPINNANTLRRIAQLPLQITNDPFANQIFNGSPFY